MCIANEKTMFKSTCLYVVCSMGWLPFGCMFLLLKSYCKHKIVELLFDFY